MTQHAAALLARVMEDLAQAAHVTRTPPSSCVGLASSRMVAVPLNVLDEVPVRSPTR